jgi:glyoxylase-like metal-dependent hydrolase (beta-lactamase superfamily II)
MHPDLTALGIKTFTGGDLETNCFLIPAPGGNILVDAPQGAAKEFQETPIGILFLTHGHFDHVWDAAEIVRAHGCPVAMHPDTEQLLADRGLLRRLGIDLEIEPISAGITISAEGPLSLIGGEFRVFHVPGHCPGSLCLLDSCSGSLYGGDVLFAGGVGRWDLPGGDRELLLDGIRTKLLSLPDQTLVCPGHGPLTTIGRERVSNPYLQPPA